MKRPLCYLCVAFVVTVFIWLKQNPLPDAPIAEGGRSTFLGEVDYKECREDTLILYLKHVRQWNPNETEQALMEDKTGTGMICYVEQPAAAEPKLGAVIAVCGQAYGFREARNPGGFDARSYYAIQGLDFALYQAEIIAQGEGFSPYREGLYRIRGYFEGIFDRLLPERDASVMKAMVLGSKSGLDTELKDLYRQSGISHILAISGLHITLIGMGLYRLLRRIRVPAAAAALLSVLLMTAYGDMAGMSSSAYRAVFMFGMKLLAGILRRTYDMLSAVALAAALLLVEQPLYLFHTGFLLSFGAILGLGCLYEVVKDAKCFAGSLSIFLIHFPIMLCTYYTFPIYSFLLNLIVIPAMSGVMGLGLLCLALGSVPIPPIGDMAAGTAAWGCHLLLALFERLSSLSLLLPEAEWIVGRPDNWRVACFYGAVLFLYVSHAYIQRINKRNAARGKHMEIRLPLRYKMLLILAAVCMLSRRTADGFTMTFVDVGQGDCIWMETPTGHHYLVDGGSTSEKNIGRYTLAPFLKYTGTARLDAVFLTHLDSDHISGIFELLETDSDVGSGIRIDRIVISAAAIRDGAYMELEALCAANGIPLEYASTGDVLDSGDGLQITVLHPETDYKTDSRNAYSLAMKLAYTGRGGTFGALLTGDIEADGEAVVAELLAGQDWTCHLYKAAHHGSKYSNSEELLAVIRPQLTVISCGEGNRYGHPHEETLARIDTVGSAALATKDTGAVFVRVRSSGARVECFLE
ncbi:MAG: DNA internalization-related competence protein ComEC/Rec2 [Roseburia sp.]|nr:DNA internalization-related competence protein ComEC/Rec2 [Roseburia sp.]